MIKGVSFFTTKSATLACSSPNEKIVKGSQKDRQYNGKKTEGQTIQWQKDRRTDNTMAKTGIVSIILIEKIYLKIMLSKIK
jgi:hypothetical protein